jgi:putative transposase
LYKDGNHSWNADCVGAFNILRLYLKSEEIKKELNPYGIKTPYIVKVAV